jgi:hypothetical protein
MRRRVPIIVLAALLLAFSSVSRAEVEQLGNLRVHFSAQFAPRSLPRQHPAPIEVNIQGSVATTDGSHPPPLQVLEVKLNRSGRLFTRGLPTCRPSLLQSTSSNEALARCGDALVGHGSFTADLALGGNEPILSNGKILAFNGRRSDRPALFLHFFGGVPVRFTLIVPLKIGHLKAGRYGTVLRTRIPKLAGGFGSITQIDLSLGRRWSFAGKRRSYLSAACSAPAGFPGASFAFASANFRFQAHRALHPTLVRSCHVR